MAVKVQRATVYDHFACHIRRRGGQVRIVRGVIASARVLAGWASSRLLAPPALATFCTMMVRFTPRLPTNPELTACVRAPCVRSMENRHCKLCAMDLRVCASSESQLEGAILFWSHGNLICASCRCFQYF